ncbi:uncharacterized protein LOC106640614 [Copidosoma floridanum]|uniref:uncharacterized protein LOC106640614 n=1 Tax=Copidosoma floridanum TaxID=29053 RepID=UPI0006C9BBDD|nr:uncharacterized protein LOC106640614 [Copidosoma floridanum]
MAVETSKSLSIKARLFSDRLEGLEKFVGGADVDRVSATLCLGDLTRKFQECEDLIEAFSVENGKVMEVETWPDISKRYYKIASNIAKLNALDGRNNASLVGQGGVMGSSTFVEHQRLLKLPVVELPRFSGGHEEWLSYKNTFLTMINSRSDMDKLVKFMYSRNTLQGEALNKISIYTISAENYDKAWKTLVNSYERWCILISKHLDAILDILPLKTATSKNLSIMVDKVKQHLNSLEFLGGMEPPRMVVRLLERALPSPIRERWEDSLAVDELPNL